MKSINQSIFEACLPWAICLVLGFVVARLLVTVSGAKWQTGRLRSLHTSETGTVQSLSFVLTLPFFVMILMMIVQVSQIMFANVIVHYSALAAVRSAAVWIPANVNEYETTNRISSMTLINSDSTGEQYLITPGSQKFSKIQQAAALACLPLGPSRDLGYSLTPDDQASQLALEKLYRGHNPSSQSNQKIATRLRNKLAFVSSNTEVRLTSWHRNTIFAVSWRDPPLQVRYDAPPYRDEYYMNEIGWQDELTAQVSFNVPLLPGPVRFFRPTGNFDANSGSSASIDQSGETYIWPISASATMGVEGQKPLMSIWQEEFQ